LDGFGVLKRVSRLVGAAGLSPFVFCAKEGVPSISTRMLKQTIFKALFTIGTFITLHLQKKYAGRNTSFHFPPGTGPRTYFHCVKQAKVAKI
jgi:hypothetical protein